MGYCLLDWVTLSPRLQRDEHQLAELRETSFHDSLCLNLGVGVELYQEGDAPSRAHLLPKGSPKSPLQWDGGGGGLGGEEVRTVPLGPPALQAGQTDAAAAW